MARSNPPFMSGVPELLLLRLLAKREMYGYELVRAIRQVTGDAISLGEGAQECRRPDPGLLLPHR